MFETSSITKRLTQEIEKINPLTVVGRVSKVIGLVLESEGPKAKIGEICNLVNKERKIISKSEIVGFRGNQILSMVLGDLQEIEPGTQIIATGEMLNVKVGDALLGRVLDGLGNPIDGKGEIIAKEKRTIYASPPSPLQRQRISKPVATGIKAIDSFLTLGKGQRVGIFSGSGVGKSTLLGIIARKTSADINIIALIGERGREVREFLEKDLGQEGLNRSVVVVATSDAPSLVRVKAALVATTIAEYFRDKGLDVMFMMDSSTRLAMAQREIGLTIGEPPTTKGYTPSVFALLQKVMERAGTSVIGSITGLYTVLVEGDDLNEPVADTARGILDGHIVLSRKLASMGHYPAIDVLESISRVMNDIITKEHKVAVSKAVELLATYRNSEDLISVGAYQRGTNPKIDRAISMHDTLMSFLKQEIEETHSFEETIQTLISITSKV